MEAKIFSYKIDGIVLEPVDDQLKISKSFNRKEALNQLKETLKEQNFRLDESSLNYKIIDGQLYVEGLAVEQQEAKSIGFMTGK